jgi:nucleoside-diphosphate-sugar epimerase
MSRGRDVVRVSRDARGGLVGLGDFTGETDWRPVLDGCDAVVHLMARVHRAGDDPATALELYRRDNVEVTLQLARQAAALGVRRLVFLSTVKVNGESTAPGQAFSEADVPKPSDPYGVSKAEAEAGLRQLSAETGLEVTILRPPLVYGAGVKGNLRTLMRWVERGVPLPLGVVNNRRSMVGLGNLSDAIMTTIDHPAAANRTFMVSDGEDLSTSELLRRIARLMGKPSRLLPVPQGVMEGALRLVGRGDLATRLLGDLRVESALIRQELGWAPRFSVEAGLGEMVFGYRGEELVV